MFKRFVKAVKDVAKKVWEFIKKLLPKKPKPKEEVVEPKPDEEGEEPAGPEETEPIEVEPAIEDDDGDEVIPYRLDGVVPSGKATGFIRIHNTNDTRVIQEYFHSVDELLSTHKNNGLNKAFSHVQKETMNRVKQLLNYGERLAAVKLLYEASGSSLKEAKEFCNNFQN